MLQIHTKHLRVCKQRSVGYSVAVRTAGVYGFRRVTPATASMDTPWTCPAWLVLVRTTTIKKNKHTYKIAVLSLCNFFPLLSTDVNECSELNTRMSLCKNAKCINTVGSYQCECLLGFTVSDKPNYCVEAAAHQTHTQRA